MPPPLDDHFLRYFFKEIREIRSKVHKGDLPDYVGNDPYHHGLIEKKAFEICSELTTIQVPKVDPLTREDLLITDFVTGMKAFDLITELDYLSQNEEQDGAALAKFNLLERIVKDIEIFQGHNTEFQKAFGDISKPYAYAAKALQVLGLWKRNCQIGSLNIKKLEEEIRAIGTELEKRATVHFKDATPKNMIVRDPFLFHYQELGVRMLLQKGVLDSIYFLRNLFHIDMRSIIELVTPEDDYLSLLLHHFVTDKERKSLSVLDNFEQKDLDASSFGRGIRLYGRRLAYWHNHPDLFKVRYTLEPMKHYWQILETSIQALSKSNDYPTLADLTDCLGKDESHKEFLDWSGVTREKINLAWRGPGYQ